MRAQSKSTLQPQEPRQSRRDEERVGNITLPQWPFPLGGHNPTTDRVAQTRRTAQRFSPVSKRTHSKAAIASPTPNASRVLRIKFERGVSS